MLITIGIVGVVASMTLPSVIENHKKQETLSKIKKVYSILSQAQIRAITENGDYEFWENGHLIGANDYFNKYYKPYFSILKICNNYCGYGMRFPWKQMNGTGWPHSIFINDYKLPFILSDGVLVVFSVSTGNDDPDKAREDSKIYVDINAAKAPNRLGQDTFIFIRTNKGILPFGIDQTEDEINADCSMNGTGESCAAKIVQDGWQISKDYYWK